MKLLTHLHHGSRSKATVIQGHSIMTGFGKYSTAGVILITYMCTVQRWTNRYQETENLENLRCGSSRHLHSKCKTFHNNLTIRSIAVIASNACNIANPVWGLCYDISLVIFGHSAIISKKVSNEYWYSNSGH